MNFYAVMVKNGTIRSVQSQEEQEKFEKLNEANDYEGIVELLGVDTYLQKGTKENANFMNWTTNIMDAQLFPSKEEVKAFVAYLDVVSKNMPTKTGGEIKAIKIMVNIKEYKKYELEGKEN